MGNPITGDPFESEKSEYLNKVFTSEWMTKINQKYDLNLSEEKQIEFRKIVSWIGASYDLLKRSNTGKSTFAKSRELLQEAADNLIAARKALSSAMNNDLMVFYNRIHFTNQKTVKFLYKEEIGYKEETGEKRHSQTTDFQTLFDLINTMAFLFAEAAKKENDPPTRLPTVALYSSIHSILPFWRDYIADKITFTEGEHFGKPVGYNSDAVDFLWEIYSLIDPELEKTQMGTAIKGAKEAYKKTH